MQHIHDAIRDAIVRLEIPPGALIDKSALCERLGVSRFPVSEALGVLPRMDLSKSCRSAAPASR